MQRLFAALARPQYGAARASGAGLFCTAAVPVRAASKAAAASGKKSGGKKGDDSSSGEAAAAETAAAAGDDEQHLSVEESVRKVEQTFGRGTLQRLDAVASSPAAGAVSTGSLALDAALGGGGVARGRMTELFGPESSGKTTVALHIIAEAQRGGGHATFVDAEHALDAAYAARLGVDTGRLYVAQPDNGEQALDIVDALVRANSMDVIVVDSVAALVPKAELDGDIGDQHVGRHARMMSQAMRKLTGSLGQSKTALVFTNQIRMKIGVMFGNPEVTPGGNALKFYATQRIDVRRAGNIKQADNIVGIQVKAKVIKNKLAPPFRTATFDIEFGRGISRSGELVDLGVTTLVLEKAGSWYSFNGQKIAQGRERVKEYLDQHPDVAAAVQAAVRDALVKSPSALASEEGGE